MSSEMEPDMSAYAACWNEAKFFEAHETLEPRWIRERDPGLQALIQLAAALHHLARANLRGAHTMIDRCLKRFDAAGPAPCSVDLKTMAAYARRVKREAGVGDREALIAARPHLG